MQSTIVSLLALLAVLFINIGCTANVDRSYNQTESKGFTQCTEPRPQICTQEYNPVCATLTDGSGKTYATGCTACGDPHVTGYVAGACE